MSTLPEEFMKAQKQAEGKSIALNAAMAIAEMDPHSREDLLCYVTALNEAQQAGDDDEMHYLVKAITEVFMIDEDSIAIDMDAWEAEAEKSPEGRKARQIIQDENHTFIAHYQQLKSQAGFRTIHEVAEASGLSPTTVQAFEAQRVKPQARTIQALANAFKISVAELLGG